MLVLLPALRDATAPLVPASPWIVFGAGILLGWRFNRIRLVGALAALFAAERILHYAVSGAVSDSGRALGDALAILLPLDLAALTFLPERGGLNRRGRLIVAVALGEGLVLYLLSRPEAAPIATILRHAFVEPRLLGWTATPQLAILAFLAAFAGAAVRYASCPNAAESATLWTLVAAFVAVSVPGAGAVSTIYLVTGGLILAVSLIEMSHAMAYGDELTGLPSRRALTERLETLGDGYAVAMVDVDHFKRFNDRHGHDVGDQLLRMVGSTLSTVGGGKAFRYGGEEFAVIFPGMSAKEALPHLEALRKRVEASGFVKREARRPRQKPDAPKAGAGAGKRLAVTVSIGVADSHRAATPAAVLKAADQALYRAKEAGRNRVYA